MNEPMATLVVEQWIDGAGMSTSKLAISLTERAQLEVPALGEVLRVTYEPPTARHASSSTARLLAAARRVIETTEWNEVGEPTADDALIELRGAVLAFDPTPWDDVPKLDPYLGSGRRGDDEAAPKETLQ